MSPKLLRLCQEIEPSLTQTSPAALKVATLQRLEAQLTEQIERAAGEDEEADLVNDLFYVRAAIKDPR